MFDFFSDFKLGIMSTIIAEFEGIRTLRFYLTPQFEENWSELKSLFVNLELSLESKQFFPYFKKDVTEFGIKKGTYITAIDDQDWSNYKYLVVNNICNFTDLYDLLKGRSTVGDFVKIKLDTNPFDVSVTKSLRVSPTYMHLVHFNKPIISLGLFTKGLDHKIITDVFSCRKPMFF